MLSTAEVLENIPGLDRRDALALADAIVDDMIAALKRDCEIPLRSFAQWELALADLRERIAEQIADEIEGHVDRGTVLLEIEAAEWPNA
jgi:nucleoid DNA-binding protein